MEHTIDEPENPKDRDMKLLKSHTLQLMEHFDNVQIFATRQDSEGNGTITADFGGGNWYARYGQIVEWTETQNERARVNVRTEND